jgi:hypothetical protein
MRGSDGLGQVAQSGGEAGAGRLVEIKLEWLYILKEVYDSFDAYPYHENIL